LLDKVIVQGGFSMSKETTIRRAVPEDTAQVRFLLQEAGIEPEGVEDWIDSFLLAETIENGSPQIQAMIGLEKYGSKGLLRSLLIRNQTQSLGSGLQLLEILLSQASKFELEELYLLTESTNAEIFIHMEFSPILSSEIPPEILNSEHFQRNLEKAVPMKKII
jgi:N-acetylglutamate synthase-like GNAT family acetyltransferase